MQQSFYLSIIAFMCAHIFVHANVDLVLFSFDRPLQLYSLLESIEKYATHTGHIHIVYRASNSEFANAYIQVKKRFSKGYYHKQGALPYDDFKVLTLASAFQSPSEYIAFAVDDIIFTDYVDFDVCVNALKSTQAYGFYIRLGTNITQCYCLSDLTTPLPPYTHVTPDVLQFKFNESKGDWAYPNTVDCTVYKKSDIQPMLEDLDFKNPNSLELLWHGMGPRSEKGLCFNHSRIVNIPLNVVNESWTNRHMHSYSSAELLTLFKQNQKIDITALYRIENKSPHMDYEPRFISRDNV